MTSDRFNTVQYVTIYTYDTVYFEMAIHKFTVAVHHLPSSIKVIVETYDFLIKMHLLTFFLRF